LRDKIENKMVSMKEIAARCGVSVATVSKSLNDKNDIGEPTKQRIRYIAKQMGYFPNGAAKTLKTHRTYSIGILNADGSICDPAHDYFWDLLMNFKSTAEQKGYGISFINSYPNVKNSMSYLEHCYYRGFDGILIIRADFNDYETIRLIASDIPTVIIDYMFQDKISIMCDDIRGMKKLLTYIYEQGHRKIAYIHGADSPSSQSRLRGFYYAAGELNLGVADEYVVKGAYRDAELAAKITNRLLDLEDPPTCICYPDDLSALGGMNAIKRRGLSVPDDISVAGYDGFRIGEYLEPQLTTVRLDTAAMGRLAAEKLIGLLERPTDTLIEKVMVEGSVFQGKSVKKIQAFSEMH